MFLVQWQHDNTGLETQIEMSQLALHFALHVFHMNIIATRRPADFLILQFRIQPTDLKMVYRLLSLLSGHGRAQLYL